MIYSTMARCLGQRGSVDHFFAFLELVKKAEIDTVNLSFAEFQTLLDDDFDEEAFAARFLATGLKANFAHAPMYYPFLFNDTDGKDWEKTMMVALSTAAKCGIKDFVMHPGSVVDQERFYLPLASRERNLAYFYPYIKRGAELGVRIALENGINQPWDDENVYFHDVSPNFDELISITDTFNTAFGKEVCGICFDFGHANVAGFDIPAEIHKVGQRLRVTHIHDNNGKRDQHLPIGEGNIDWPKVKSALDDIGFDRELSLELYYDSEPRFEKDPVAHLKTTYSALCNL